MIPAERQRTILSLLSHQEVLSISDLTDHLGVSHMTIRRDIVKLESSGKVVSVSGGVQLAQALHSELSHDAKVEQQADEKKFKLVAGGYVNWSRRYDLLGCGNNLSRNRPSNSKS